MSASLTISVDRLCSDLLTLRDIEARITDMRRAAEDAILAAVGASEATEGVETHEVEGYTIKVYGRMNRKVDADRLQELAAEAGLTEHLADLFRWKPEVNLAAWKKAATSITTPLAAAITTTPGRPSVAVQPIEKE